MEIIETIFVALAYVVAIGFLISGLDDLFFDSQLLVFLWRGRNKPHLTLQDLKLAHEQWIAIFVPAWQEGGVVNRMAEYAARVLLYEKYDLFIGVYPNDLETIKCVDEVCATNPRIHKVMVPHPGPTNKADCLNWIHRAMRLNEIPGTREYQVIAIHDAEDIIHPLVLKVYNYFVPAHYDMGQVPVFPLELPVCRYWTGNTYIDDFAELHTKDLFARQSIGGIVPSAGVGTAFSRAALEKLAADGNGDPFSTGNLTEDYEVAIRIKRAGFRAGFLSVPVDRVVHHKQRDGTPAPSKTITEIVAVRESFPKTFRTAVRQRSRWILGISFQTWEQTGWEGTLPMRYTLVRDRRAPLNHLINFAGYLVLGFVAFQWIFRHTPWAADYYIRPVFTADSLLWKIVIIDSGLLAYRALQKFISVKLIYNTKQAVFSIPRVVTGNFINFTATLRAAKMYLASKLLGHPVVWLKTAHVFPDDIELSEYTKSIEDLLVEEGLATHEQILNALKVEKAASAPLCLLRMGLLDEKRFVQIWSRYSRLPPSLVDPSAIPDVLLSSLSELDSEKLGAIPATRSEHVAIAFQEPPSEKQLIQLRQLFGTGIRAVLAPPSNLAFARDTAYPRLILPPSSLSRQIEHFRQAAHLDEAQFLELLSTQHAARQNLADVLVAKALLSEADARKLWAECIGCRPSDVAHHELNNDIYHSMGPIFWWLHRMLPVKHEQILTALPPHPLLIDRLSKKLGNTPRFTAELPAAIELTARRHGVQIDPDQAILDGLAASQSAAAATLPDLKAMRKLIADPLPKWLLLHKRISPEQLHQLFVDICNLPLLESWNANEVRRLWPVLPPGFAKETGCYCLDEQQGALRIGLAQLPSPPALRRLHQRLAGYPVFFQALSYQDAQTLRGLG
jgi:bacteriophage N4 adsorption protein B